MRVAKWGNSLAIRLPAAVVEALELRDGDEIDVQVLDDRTFAVARSATVEKRLARLRRLRGRLPEGFRFDRDEAHERS